LNASVIPQAIIIILCGLAVRLIVVFIVTTGLQYNLRERLFVCVCFIPKATVQAALASAPLRRLQLAKTVCNCIQSHASRFVLYRYTGDVSRSRFAGRCSETRRGRRTCNSDDCCIRDSYLRPHVCEITGTPTCVSIQYTMTTCTRLNSGCASFQWCHTYTITCTEVAEEVRR
jgi:hypothetical protein